MDSYYFRQIKLPFQDKATIIHALMRFIMAQAGSVPREDAFFKRFVADSSDTFFLTKEAVLKPWLIENVGRLFWVCCELGLLKYQYPYPHRSQTYLPTRAGRIVAGSPRTVATALLAAAYIFALIADPINHFRRLRNIVTVVTGVLLWWRHHELNSVIVVISITVGIVGAWIASFLSSLGD